MNIYHTIAVSYRISTATLLNRIIYFFKRLPLIGKAMPDKAYSFGDIKLFASVIAGIIKFFLPFVKKAIYLAVAVGTPMLLGLLDDDLQLHTNWAFAVHILFYMSIVAGPFLQSSLNEVDINKLTLVRLMHMPPRQYLLAHFFYKHFLDLIAFLPSMILMGVLLEAHFLQPVLLTVLIISAHIFGEAVQLFLYDRTGVSVTQKVLWGLPFMLIPPTAAYLPVFIGADWGTSALIFHPITIAVIIALAVLGTCYIVKYPRYTRFSADVIRPEMTNKAVRTKTQSQSRKKDVQLKEKDLVKTNSSRFERREGYAYFHAIFFERHKRMLLRMPIICCLVLLGALVIGVAAHFVVPEITKAAAERIPDILPICVFAMYFLTIGGDRIIRAMFNNCDSAMLHYSYYREPKVLLQNFRIRLFWMMKVNLTVASVFTAVLIAFTKMEGVNWAWQEMVPFALSILMLGVFFSIHYLFLYYVFQPFSSELAMKNPFYLIVHNMVYILCFISIQLPSMPRYFSLIVLGATILYTGIALILVYRFAPKSFRVK